jgi:hypothetical protein
MILMTCLGIAFLLVLAIAVRTIEAAQAPRRRRLAAERRALWAAGQSADDHLHRTSER